MIIDFHVHGKISNQYSFDEEKFLLTIEEAKNEGINSIAFTEHCHSRNFFEGYDFLKKNYELIDDYYDVCGVKVFYGVEVTTKEMIDILFIGKEDLIIELVNKITSILNGDKFLTINDLFELYNEDNLLVMLAHPFRKHEEFPVISQEVIKKIDSIEFNARDIYEHNGENITLKIEELANYLNLPIVCGSDAHYFIQMGSIKNVFRINCNKVNEIKSEIKKCNYKIFISDDLYIRVRSATLIKEIIINNDLNKQ